MDAIRIEKPVFMLGMPRSGTTIIFEAFSCHEDLGWLSNYSQRFPTLPQITSIHRIFRGARGEKRQWQKVSFANKLLPKPAESYAVWEYLLGRDFSFGFLRKDRPTPSRIRKTHQYLRKVLRSEAKTRFCAKLTGPPRIRFLSQIFTDAYFIDVVRDPRAVIASLMSVDFWKEKRGIHDPFWNGSFDDDHDALVLWEGSQRSPVVLAALLWRAVCEATAQEKQDVGIAYYRLRYEQFIDDPLGAVNDILSFCGLRESEKVNAYVGSRQYKNMNYKFWQKLSAGHIQQIERIAGKQMRLVGYGSVI